MNATTIEPNSLLPSTRHDGWTGEVMAKFLESLSDTGIVLDACDAVRKSREGAYALRRRNPLFAQGWELALQNARDRLADTLLGRAIEGNVEQIIKDGEIVGEKHYLDNRLGLAILKRLDQRAERDRNHNRYTAPPAEQAEPDWDIAINALRTGKEDDIAAALAMLKSSALNSLQGDEVDKVDTPRIDDDANSSDDLRVWQDWNSDEWRTDFPPPPNFDGFEEGEWVEGTYCRSLTEEEMAALLAAGIVETPRMISLEEDEAERDAFFASLTANKTT